MPTMMPASTRLKWAAAGWAGGFVASVLAVLAVVLVRGSGTGPGAEDLGLSLSLGWLVVLQAPLWFGLMGVPLLARRHGLDWRAQLGWWMRPSDALVGVGVGIVMQLALVPLLYWPILRIFDDLDVEGPARELADLAHGPFDVAALVVMTIIGAPIVEEVFFRGLLQGALRDRFGPVRAVALASVAFAVTHFQVVQFPALVLVGVVQGLLVLRTGRLGAAVWSHMSFNAVTVIVLLS